MRHNMVKVRFWECGQIQLFVQDSVLAQAMRDTLDTADIFVTDIDTSTCSQCARPVNVPPAELLDMDRSAFGRFLQDMDG